MPNRSVLIGTGWILTAAATFGLGWTLKPAPVSTSSSDTLEGGSALVPSKRTLSEATKASRRSETPFLDKYVVGDQISAESMKSAMKEVLDEDDPLKRAALMSALLAQLTPENAKAAWEIMKDNRGGGGRMGAGGDNSRQLFLNAWARIDGKTAVAELMAAQEAAGDQGGRGRGGMMDMFSALTGWATADVSQAAEYVEGLEDDRMKGVYMGGIVRGLLVNGLDDAVDYVSGLPADSAFRDRYMSSIADEALEDGVGSAKKWVEGLTDASLKNGAMERVAAEYAREDLKGAVDWVTENAGEDYASAAVEEVAERWAEQDPQAVIDWAASLPESVQADVYSEALDEWTERDAGAASEYLASMPDSAAKDSAVEGFATELARTDPDTALAWAETISNEGLRAEALTDVAQSWYRQDQAAVEAWLPTSGLSAEAQQAVTAAPQRDFGGRGGGGRGGR